MAKTFTDLTNSVTSQMFQCEKDENDGRVVSAIDTVLQAIVDSAVSTAIPRALYLKMEKDPREEVTITLGPFTYGISLSKSGDSLTLNPTFALTNEKKTISELSEYEEKLSKNLSLIENIANSISDDTFINTMIHACKLDQFDTTKGDWIEKQSDADKGIDLDQYSAIQLTAIHIATILHVLATIKDAEALQKYEVPGEGTYTIERVKDKWEIGFVASKEFKQAIKNDRLVESMA